ncbi:hypothetical protein A1L58_03915 [Shewanella baltica]|uniref:ImmA/IrrE family metallo-endopeptidase n=1 Tax=Shewanella baltica TaxID=62322 RepID=UPI0007B4C24F|nr:XRE family transcriptional regulator [Shewanella baltica]KZK67479.1 hypothetical protein A1L58_03915 [Shewanella baltica]
MSSAVIVRLTQFRIAKGIQQDDLATAMGFKDRQILSNIENHQRKIKPDELKAALNFMEVPMSEFVDPTSLVGKANFSWRQQDSVEATLKEIEEHASRVIGLYEYIEGPSNTSPLQFTLKVDKRSTQDDARECAEGLINQFNLGIYPSKKLEALMSELSIRVLYLDLSNTVSAAAINLTKGNYILLNRQEISARRSFSWAHELFHCLTWEALTPERVERAYTNKGSKKPIEEKLADAFAEALLMPRSSVNKHVEMHSGEMDERFIEALANKFSVSMPAMVYRLHQLEHLSTKRYNAFFESGPSTNNEKQSVDIQLLYSANFVQSLRNALYHGKVSVRKASKNLGLTAEEIVELCANYNLPSPLEE